MRWFKEDKFISAFLLLLLAFFSLWLSLTLSDSKQRLFRLPRAAENFIVYRREFSPPYFFFFLEHENKDIMCLQRRKREADRVDFSVEWDAWHIGEKENCVDPWSWPFDNSALSLAYSNGNLQKPYPNASYPEKFSGFQTLCRTVEYDFLCRAKINQILTPTPRVQEEANSTSSPTLPPQLESPNENNSPDNSFSPTPTSTPTPTPSSEVIPTVSSPSPTSPQTTSADSTRDSLLVSSIYKKQAQPPFFFFLTRSNGKEFMCFQRDNRESNQVDFNVSWDAWEIGGGSSCFDTWNWLFEKEETFEHLKPVQDSEITGLPLGWYNLCRKPERDSVCSTALQRFRGSNRFVSNPVVPREDSSTANNGDDTQSSENTESSNNLTPAKKRVCQTVSCPSPDEAVKVYLKDEGQAAGIYLDKECKLKTMNWNEIKMACFVAERDIRLSVNYTTGVKSEFLKKFFGATAWPSSSLNSFIVIRGEDKEVKEQIDSLKELVMTEQGLKLRLERTLRKRRSDFFSSYSSGSQELSIYFEILGNNEDFIFQIGSVKFPSGEDPQIIISDNLNNL